MPVTYEEVLTASRPEPAFSNSDQGSAWTARNCDRCLRDAPFRNHINATGCPILTVALTGRTPAQWCEQSTSAGGTFVCVEFRAPGTSSTGARPGREPRSMAGLFARPERQARALVEPVPSRAEQ